MGSRCVLLRHLRFRRAVPAFVDGELRSPRRAEAVAAHLRECWWCSRDAEMLRRIKASLRRLRGRRPVDLAATRLRRWAGQHLA